ncbi:MAG: saccharopine dehydrogenase NADP-binding domain-containing protein [Sulfuricella sp.]
MKPEIKHARFPGKLVMVGFGCIGQAMLPLLFRHLDIRPQQIRIVAANEGNAAIAREYGVAFTQHTLTRENYRSVLEPWLDKGDFLLNLSVDISSLALIELCRGRDALYLDTCIEPWPGGYTDCSKPVAQRTNYALREEVLVYGRANGPGPTAVVTQGANPGLASMFVKQALLDIAADSGVAANKPACHENWARLACLLGIKAIHIAERDTQTTARRKQRGEFVNHLVGVRFHLRGAPALGTGVGHA